jgi:hypothetical protein
VNLPTVSGLLAGAKTYGAPLEKMERRWLLPQISELLPAHAVVQEFSMTLVVPYFNSLPQKHWDPNSRPAIV